MLGWIILFRNQRYRCFALNNFNISEVKYKLNSFENFQYNSIYTGRTIFLVQIDHFSNANNFVLNCIKLV
jgi:hypothetical protein